MTASGRSSGSLSPVGLLRLAREQRDAGRLSEAEATCQRALSVSSANPAAHRLLGTILQADGRGGAAVASFEAAVRLDPASTGALNDLALALAQAGRLPAAVCVNRRTLELSPRDIGALSSLAQLKTFSAGDPDLVALETLAQDEEALEEQDVVTLCFTLAKAYEDVGDYDRSFRYMHRANALKRRTFHYDVTHDVRFLRQTAAAFSGELFDRLTGAGSASELPILIVGMPRSGTSLVEQILASHPGVHGGGELGHLRELAGAVSLLNENGVGFPDGVAQLRADDVDRLGEGYVGRLHQIAPHAERVTDKNNWNFYRVGLARLIVPRARVVHCIRDPLDTCVSCYSRQGEVEFASDLGELGRYYRAYAELMAHWRSVLPGDYMLEVRYEDLVDNVERQARAMVAHCGLDWDDSCLAFYATERTVRTASFAQVRRPIYEQSIGRWRGYETYLEPLLAALNGDTE